MTSLISDRLLVVRYAGSAPTKPHTPECDTRHSWQRTIRAWSLCAERLAFRQMEEEIMTKCIKEKSVQDVSDDRLDQVSGGSAFSLAISRQDVATLSVRSNLLGSLKSRMICSSCHGCGGGKIGMPVLGER